MRFALALLALWGYLSFGSPAGATWAPPARGTRRPVQGDPPGNQRPLTFKTRERTPLEEMLFRMDQFGQPDWGQGLDLQGRMIIQHPAPTLIQGREGGEGSRAPRGRGP